jgi:hypothetical protein
MPPAVWIWVCLFGILTNLQTPDARSIVQKADEKMRGSTSTVELTIKTIRPGWVRSMNVKAWMKGTDYSMILIQSPAKNKGFVFLKRKKVRNWIKK